MGTGYWDAVRMAIWTRESPPWTELAEGRWSGTSWWPEHPFGHPGKPDVTLKAPRRKKSLPWAQSV